MSDAEIIAIKNKENYDLLMDFLSRRTVISDYLYRYVHENYVGKILKSTTDKFDKFVEIIGIDKKNHEDRVVGVYPVCVIVNIRQTDGLSSLGWSKFAKNENVELKIKVNEDKTLSVVGYEIADDAEYQEYLKKFNIDQKCYDKNGKLLHTHDYVRYNGLLYIIESYDKNTDTFMLDAFTLTGPRILIPVAGSELEYFPGFTQEIIRE